MSNDNISHCNSTDNGYSNILLYDGLKSFINAFNSFDFEISYICKGNAFNSKLNKGSGNLSFKLFASN